MHRTTLKGVALGFTAAIVAVTMGATSAWADAPFTPDADDLVGVGSDTTQFVMNDLANGYNSATSPVRRLASWDATGSTTIVPRANAQEITRPNGSSAGLNALAANPSLDFSRSSSGPAGYDATFDGYTFYALASDRVSVAVAADNGDGKPASNAPASLRFTVANLQDIYRCLPTADQWSDLVAGASSATILPLIPQAGSGTRKFFLEQLGLTDADLGGCVVEAQEHDATPIDADANAIAPFSEARFATAVPSVNGTKVIALRNTLGNFRPSRTVYNVTRTADVATFDGIFGSAGYFCSADGDAIVTANGFGVLDDTACGVKTAI